MKSVVIAVLIVAIFSVLSNGETIRGRKRRTQGLIQVPTDTAVQSIVQNAAGTTKGVMSEAQASFKGAIDGTVTGAQEAVGNSIGTASNIFNETMANAQNTVNETLSVAGNVVGTTVASVESAIDQTAESVGTAVTTVVNNTGTAVENLIGSSPVAQNMADTFGEILIAKGPEPEFIAMEKECQVGCKVECNSVRGLFLKGICINDCMLACLPDRTDAANAPNVGSP